VIIIIPEKILKTMAEGIRGVKYIMCCLASGFICTAAFYPRPLIDNSTIDLLVGYE